MVYRFYKRFSHDERGTISAELAIVIPILIFLTLIPLIYGMAVWAKIVVIDAAREGARYQALNLGDPNYIINQTIIDGHLDTGNISQVTVNTGMTYTSVQAKYNQPSIVPGAGALLGANLFSNTIPLSHTSVFKVEQ